LPTVTACVPTYLNSDKLLNVLYVIASLLGQIVVALRVGSRRLPSWHLMVHHLSAFQDLEICRVRFQFLSIDLVGDRDLDSFEGVQDIELCQIKAGIVVD
jgi:hypothetical protein